MSSPGACCGCSQYDSQKAERPASTEPHQGSLFVETGEKSEIQLPVLFVLTAALWRVKQHPLARKYMKIPGVQGIIHQLQVAPEILQCCRVLACLDYYMRPNIVEILLRTSAVSFESCTLAMAR